jgi:hypothetical protein
MTEHRGNGQDDATKGLSDAYRDAVGSVMEARRVYDQARADHGDDSEAARQAHEGLTREMDRRNELRDQYDRILYRGSSR